MTNPLQAPGSSIDSASVNEYEVRDRRQEREMLAAEIQDLANQLIRAGSERPHVASFDTTISPSRSRSKLMPRVVVHNENELRQKALRPPEALSRPPGELERQESFFHAAAAAVAWNEQSAVEQVLVPGRAVTRAEPRGWGKLRGKLHAAASPRHVPVPPLLDSGVCGAMPQALEAGQSAAFACTWAPTPSARTPPVREEYATMAGLAHGSAVPMAAPSLVALTGLPWPAPLQKSRPRTVREVANELRSKELRNGHALLFENEEIATGDQAHLVRHWEAPEEEVDTAGVGVAQPLPQPYSELHDGDHTVAALLRENAVLQLRMRQMEQLLDKAECLPRADLSSASCVPVSALPELSEAEARTMQGHAAHHPAGSDTRGQGKVSAPVEITGAWVWAANRMMLLD